MKTSEWLWTKLGFGIIALIAAMIWGLIFYQGLVLINPAIPLYGVLKVFAIVFLLITLVKEDLIGDAGLGAVFALFGAATAVIGFESGGALTGGGTSSSQKYGKPLITCFLAGVVATCVAYISF